ncbi:MAG: xylulokinase, partial [Meiothermus sp.]|nr:xylulokinase [Meiothermus sp.]
DEGAARGAGILALVGAGVYGGLEQALQATQPAELDAPPAQAEIRALQPGYRQAVELMLERLLQR